MKEFSLLDAKEMVDNVPEGFVNVKDINRGFLVNVSDEELIKNININIRKGHKQANAYPVKQDVICIVAGGPSLEDTKDELLQAIWEEDAKVVTVNGSYQWCIDNNIRPSAAVAVDGREFNKRFFETPVVNCQYMLASQCHPAFFDALEGRDITIWHPSSPDENIRKIYDNYYFGKWNPIPGPSTVATKAMCLFRTLGYVYMHVFGLDSCIMGDKHHSYLQQENDADEVSNIYCEGRMFKATGWHVSQAEEFREFIAVNGSNFHLNIHGDGLIAHIIKTGSSIEKERN